MADSSALFACTKCNSRHPFEELSQTEQLCKDCRNNYPVVKCTYCRAEFQQGKGSTSTICKKCAQNVKSYGKPTACEYCNVIAAFIGNRCQRCTNSEKKWGPPMTCEQCKQKCAFDRSEDSRKKVDGKTLCWLCTLAYRRVLAKTRNRQEESLKNYGSQRLSDSIGTATKPIIVEGGSSAGSSHENTEKNRNGEKGSGNNENRTGSEKRDRSSEPSGKDKSSSGSGDKATKDKHNSNDKHHHHHHHHRHHHHHHHRHGSSDKHGHHGSRDKSKDHKSSSHKSKTHHSNNKSHHDHSSGKKPKLDSTPTSGATTTTTKTTTNGVTPTKGTSLSTSMASLTEKSIPDLNSTDHMIAITQLREELEALKKQIQGKDQQMKEKEMKITELKARQYESEKEVRAKITTLQKRHSEAIETLQIKNRDLMKQVASLSKGNKNKSIATGSPSL